MMSHCTADGRLCCSIRGISLLSKWCVWECWSLYLFSFSLLLWELIESTLAYSILSLQLKRTKWCIFSKKWPLCEEWRSLVTCFTRSVKFAVSAIYMTVRRRSLLDVRLAWVAKTAWLRLIVIIARLWPVETPPIALWPRWWAKLQALIMAKVVNALLLEEKQLLWLQWYCRSSASRWNWSCICLEIQRREELYHCNVWWWCG